MVLELKISTVDVGIVLVYLAAVVIFGLWIGRGKKNLEEYLLSGRDLPWWAILGSIIATETSTVTFLSIPGILYAADGNLTFLQLTFGYIIGRLLVVVLFIPRFFRGEMFTAYQVLSDRFGGITKQGASLLFMVTRTLADGLRLFLTAIVLEKVVGLDLAMSIVVIGIATIVYTFFGGMKSVVWNDCIQLVVYIVGACIAGWMIVQKVPGGLDEISRFAIENDKLQWLDLSTDLSKPLTLWAGLIGGAFVSMATHGSDQLMVQRYLCARNQRQASLAVGASGFVVMLQFALFLLLGVGLACYYHVYPPASPLSNDQVFATFIVDEIPPVLRGLILAAVFSAAMSTLSSSLNSSSTALVNDFLRRGSNQETLSPREDARLTRSSRFYTALFGLAQILVGVTASLLPADSISSVVSVVMAIASFSTGIILGLFFLAISGGRARQFDALIGMFVGTLVTLVIVGLPLIHQWMMQAGFERTAQWFEFRLGWPWYAVVGSITTLSVGIASSLVVAGKGIDAET